MENKKFFIIFGVCSILVITSLGWHWVIDRVIGTKNDITHKFDVPKDVINKQVAIFPTECAQLWKFEDTQKITTEIADTKIYGNEAVVTIKVSAIKTIVAKNGDLRVEHSVSQDPKTGVPHSDENEKVMKLNGSVKLYYEKVNNEWILKDVVNQTLKISD